MNRASEPDPNADNNQATGLPASTDPTEASDVYKTPQTIFPVQVIFPVNATLD